MGQSITIRVDKQQETNMQFQPPTIWNGASKLEGKRLWHGFFCMPNKLVHHSSVLRSLSSA